MENSATSDPENTAESSSNTTRRRPCAAKVNPSASGVAPRGDCKRNKASAWAGSKLRTVNYRQLCVRIRYVHGPHACAASTNASAKILPGCAAVELSQYI